MKFPFEKKTMEESSVCVIFFRWKKLLQLFFFFSFLFQYILLNVFLLVAFFLLLPLQDSCNGCAARDTSFNVSWTLNKFSKRYRLWKRFSFFTSVKEEFRGGGTIQFPVVFIEHMEKIASTSFTHYSNIYIHSYSHWLLDKDIAVFKFIKYAKNVNYVWIQIRT